MDESSRYIQREREREREREGGERTCKPMNGTLAPVARLQLVALVLDQEGTTFKHIDLHHGSPSTA